MKYIFFYKYQINQQPRPKGTGYVVLIRYLYSRFNTFFKRPKGRGIKPLNTNKKLVCKFGIAEESADGGADGSARGDAAKSAAAGTICGIFFDCVSAPNGYEKRETPLIKKAAEQLGEYFEGGRKSFNLPLSLHGTDFQIKVWNALQNIPYGKTLSYGELAAITGNPKASRAVGMANNRNPIPIIIPCHRVIGKDGSLTGYAGGLELKRQLLALENK